MTLEDTPLQPGRAHEPEPVGNSLISPERPLKKRQRNLLLVILPLLTFAFGILGGYLIWGRSATQAKTTLASLQEQVNPKEGFALPVKYGQLGPQLVAGGAIDYDAFVGAYEKAGKPLTQEQKDILAKGSDEKIVINQQNAYFLLNYFWAVGLANKNPVLDSGPITQESGGQIDQFASTGGWTISTKPVKEVFSSLPMLNLNADQQKRLEEAAKAVYRPCCNNPTYFPDCNHGMAMLGLFELMASQNASVKDMLAAAKSVNAFWFPEQTLEQAVFFKNSAGLNYKNVDAETVVGKNYSSSSGFQQMHQWLAGKGLLEQSPNSGGKCGV